MKKWKKEPQFLELCPLCIFTDRNRLKIRMALAFDVLKNCSLFHYEEYPFFMC
jgi:hypothetical protein